MTPSPRNPIARTWGVLALCLLMVSCVTSDTVLQEARSHLEGGRGEEALVLLDKAARQNPENPTYRSEYYRHRDMLAAQWLSQAETLRLAGQFEAAEELYRRVQRYEAENARAQAGLAQIETDKRHRALVGQAEKLVKEGNYGEAEILLRPVVLENPGQRDARRLQRIIEEKTVKPALAEPQLKSAGMPITLELRDVSLRSVFDVIGRAAGISFVFDKDVRVDQTTSIAVSEATVGQLIRLVLSANQLADKVVNEKTVFVYPNTPQKRREHQDVVVKSFYVTNADVKQTANMIRSVVRTRDIFIDEKSGMLVIRDTPNSVRIAERLIAAQDLAEPEVMLEVEVLEIGYTKLLDLGLRFPTSIAWSLVGGGAASASGTPGVLTLPEWLNRGSELVRLSVTDPLFLLSLRQQDGLTNVLANPRIRVKNKEKAKIHIGDRVPVITTTAAATGGFISESVSYIDVGLKLEVEPVIYVEDEVGIKVGLEVSNIVREVRGTTTGTLTYQIGTRNASTVLRLKDGETQILAGLINKEDRRIANRVPGVGELPVVGRLFSDTHDTIGKTEIVLLITPRLLRTLARPDARTVEFAVGTDASTDGAGPQLPALRTIPQQRTAPKPAAPPAPSTPPPPSGSTLVPFGGMQPAR